MIWSSKEAHNLHWGYWIQKPDAQDRRIHSDNYEPCWDISATDGNRHVFQFGNIWASKPEQTFYNKPFQHYTTIPHDNWHFWDNPELPQFLWPNPANPRGRKDWVRWVKGHILTPTQLPDDSDRINSLLAEFSKGQLTDWRDLVKMRDVTWNNSKTVLIVPSSAPNYEHYYNTTQQAWINGVTKQLSKMGYTWEIRWKSSRSMRTKTGELHTQLKSTDYACTVSQHSVAALETVCAGVPAVVTGPHPAGELATPWEEFVQGEFRLPCQDDIEQWCAGVLHSIKHKRELFTGEW